MIQVIVDYAVLCDDDDEEWTSDCVDVVWERNVEMHFDLPLPARRKEIQEKGVGQLLI